MPEKRTIIKNAEADAQDQRAKQVLDAAKLTVEQRLKQPEYRQHVESLLEDLQKGFLVKAINVYEAEEYCLIVENPQTKQIKSYAFETPLPLSLPPEDAGQAKRTVELIKKLQSWIA